ncbi:hypothetical protein KFU94_01745 [Chloroflexi bacterium TSY]|nr:hypothetical protein [Chloroflexi bacterium TSY]
MQKMSPELTEQEQTKISKEAECNSPECVQARMRLQAARNKILSICSKLDQLRKSLSSWNTAIAVLLGVISALVIAAGSVFPIPVVGPFAAAFLLGVAGLLLLLVGLFALFANNLRTQVSDAERELAAANDAFANAVEEVMATCPPECWEGLDQPRC